MNQTNHFFNLGYGWLCKHCSNETAEQHHSDPGGRFPHVQNEGKDKSALLGLALVGWTDATRQTLKCPRCGIDEKVVPMSDQP